MASPFFDFIQIISHYQEILNVIFEVQYFSLISFSAVIDLFLLFTYDQNINSLNTNYMIVLIQSLETVLLKAKYKKRKMTI
jgi:hypothetical protein